MYKWLFSIFTCGLLLSSAGWAQTAGAGERHKHWEFSLFGGASFLGDDRFVTPVQGQESGRDVGLNYASGYIVGARISENLGQHLGAELEYGYANQPLQFTGLRPSLPVLEADHRAHKLAYSLLFYPLKRNAKIRPFASVGAGATFYQILEESETAAASEGIDLRDRWKFAFSYGGGVKVALSDRWGIRGDFRDQITGVPSYGLPATSPVISGQVEAGFRPTGTQHNWHLAAGVFYMWERN